MQILATDHPLAFDRPALVIRRVDAIPVALPLVKPVRMASETVTHAHNILVRVEAADGAVGWGEAASAPTMTGDTLGGLTAAVRDHLGPALIGADAWMRPALMKRLRAVLHGNTGVHSAVEMALLDLAGQASGLPFTDLTGGALRREVAPMWLIGNATPDEDVAEAKAKAREGVDGRDKPGHATVAHGFVSLKPACEKEIAGAKKPQARRTCGGDRRRTSAPAL
jgi:L-alanine-DL-glutamate epimerase-like enolase superfamily enzyme